MEKIRLSIITASHRKTPWFPEMMDSVLKSGYHFRNTELIFCNDGAADGGDAVLAKEYAKQYPDLIRIIENPERRGIAGAFSRLVEEAKGTYVMPFDTDDVFVPFDIDASLDRLDADVSIAGIYGKKRLFHNELGDQGEMHGGDESVFAMTLDPRAVHNAQIVRRQDILDAGNYQYTAFGIDSMAADVFLWLRLALRKPMVFSNEIRALFRVHGNQSSGSRRQSYAKEYDFCRNWLLKEYRPLAEKLTTPGQIVITPKERRPAMAVLGALYVRTLEASGRVGFTNMAVQLDPWDYGAREYRIKEYLAAGRGVEALNDAAIMLSQFYDRPYILSVAIRQACNAAELAKLDASAYEDARKRHMLEFFRLTPEQLAIFRRTIANCGKDRK